MLQFSRILSDGKPSAIKSIEKPYPLRFMWTDIFNGLLVKQLVLGGSLFRFDDALSISVEYFCFYCQFCHGYRSFMDLRTRWLKMHASMCFFADEQPTMNVHAGQNDPGDEA